MNRGSILLAALAAGTLACSEASAPDRAELYEWRLFVIDSIIATDTTYDTLSFHWPESSLPVKVWVEDSLDMPDRMAEAIATWEGAFLYGEYQAVLVTDSSTADVVVFVGNIPPAATHTAARLRTVFPGCEGATDVDTLATRFQLRLPVRIHLDPRYDPETNDLTECFRVVATHELGHSLGLFQHSDSAGDIMYPQPEASAPSERDMNTAQVLSHWPANLIPTR